MVSDKGFVGNGHCAVPNEYNFSRHPEERSDEGSSSELSMMRSFTAFRMTIFLDSGSWAGMTKL